MTLKEQIFDDIDAVFMNTDEFADEHTINGNKVVCIIEDDQLTEQTASNVKGTYLGDKIVLIKASLLPARPAVKSRFILDGESDWFVKSCIDDMGVYEIRIGANRT